MKISFRLVAATVLLSSSTLCCVRSAEQLVDGPSASPTRKLAKSEPSFGESSSPAADAKGGSAQEPYARRPRADAQHEASTRRSAKQPSLHQKTYHFQHRLLPNWVHGTKGEFYKDLLAGRSKALMRAASKYSQKVSVKTYPKKGGVLLGFQSPIEPTECYFAYISKTPKGFRFFTYEKSVDLFGDGLKGSIGEWHPGARRSNLGFRKYTDENSFLADVQSY